jgi:spermidine synthase
MMVLLACATLSHQQLRHWSSSLAFWTRAVEVSPGAIAYRQLANELMNVNRPDEALPHAERAIEIDPRSAPAHHTRGAVLLIQGHTAAAGIEFFRALEIDPDFAPSLLASASVLHAQGAYARAADLFERVVRLRPDYAQQPDALHRYAESLDRELASGQVGFAEAVEDHRRALALLPDWIEVRQRLAWLLATHPQATAKDGREAIVHAQRAMQAGGRRTRSELDTLAAAYAAAGDFSQAIAVSERNLARAELGGETLVAASIRERLALYRAGQLYRADPAAAR